MQRRMPEPLFTPDGDLFVPSDHTRGPWEPGAQHAGPPAALMVRAVEALPADSPMHVSRFTLEALRPIPLAPLRVSARLERPGRRVQLAEVTLHAGEVEVARARALRIRAADVGVAPISADSSVFTDPERSLAHTPAGGAPAFHETGVEMRFARGTFIEPGPAAVWIRLRRPVVAGEEPSPVQRALAASDFGNGVSAVLDWQGHLFINPDLTVYLFRPPAGEWICLDARTSIGPAGVGVAHSALYDASGQVGYALQALLVDRRPSAAR